MREEITPEILASEIRMERAQFPGLFLIVEGETDEEVYGKFIDQKNCQIILTNGKEDALELLNILESSRFDGAIGIVDKDFDGLLLVKYKFKGIFQTDVHDLELMLFDSGAFQNVMRVRADKKKVAKLEKKFGNFKSMIYRLAYPIGCLRFASLKEELSLKFKGMKYNFFDKKFSVDKNELVRYLVARTQKVGVTKANSLALLTNEELKNHPILEICNGHDICELWAIVMKKCEKGSKKTLTSDTLEKELRIAYNIEDFSKSKLYKNLKKWKRVNRKFDNWLI